MLKKLAILFIIANILMVQNVFAVDYTLTCNTGTCDCYIRGGNCFASACTTSFCTTKEHSTCTNNCAQTKTNACGAPDCEGSCSCAITSGQCSCTCDSGYTWNGSACVASSTCTYSGSGNWLINCNDNCTISSVTTVSGSIIIYGANGNIQFSNNVKANAFYFNATSNCKWFYNNYRILY